MIIITIQVLNLAYFYFINAKIPVFISIKFCLFINTKNTCLKQPCSIILDNTDYTEINSVRRDVQTQPPLKLADLDGEGRTIEKIAQLIQINPSGDKNTEITKQK